MINIKRQPSELKSLQTKKIKEYLEQLLKHNINPDHNQKPEVFNKYRNWDVLEAFDKCFFAKCYITEYKAPANSWEFHVDHFVSKLDKPELAYEWSNLYPATEHANSLKPRNDPEGGYLDPCSKNDDVENEIIYDIAFDDSISFAPKDPTNIKAKNTAKLLNRIHLGHEKNSKMRARNLQAMILEKMKEVLIKIKFLEAKKDKTVASGIEKELQMLLSRKSSFTMLMRSIPIVKERYSHLFD